MKRARIEIVSPPTGWVGRFHHWRLVGANGQIVCVSETFKTRSSALRAAKRAKALFQTAEVVTK